MRHHLQRRPTTTRTACRHPQTPPPRFCNSSTGSTIRRTCSQRLTSFHKSCRRRTRRCGREYRLLTAMTTGSTMAAGSPRSISELATQKLCQCTLSEQALCLKWVVKAKRSPRRLGYDGP
nr:unnamed protein product [Callosobruchus chinensis]